MNNIKAKTNCFDIMDSENDIIEKLLKNDSKNIYHIQYGLMKFDGDYKDVNIKINNQINIIVGSSSKNIYDYFIHDGFAYFFFLSDYNSKKLNVDSIIKQMNSKNKINQIITCLINIGIKKFIIEKSAVSNEISIENLNECLLFAKSDNNKVDNYLKYNGYFSKERRYSYQFKKWSLVKDDYNKNIEIDEVNLNIVKKKAVKKKADARKNNKINFMNFYDEKNKNIYTNSINFYQNYMSLVVKDFFENKSIKYTDVFFNPTELIENFITMDSIKGGVELKIIDNYFYDKEELLMKKEFHEKLINNINLLYSENIEESYLLRELTINDIIYPLNYDKMDSNTAYIVINKSDNDTSINADGKLYKNFTDVLIDIEKTDISRFDYYTRIKYTNYKNENRIITQGCNINNLKSFFTDYDKCMAKKDKKQATANKNAIKLNKISVIVKVEALSMIKKLIAEIHIKKSIFIDKKINNVSIENTSLSLVYIKNNSYNKKKMNRIIEVDLDIIDNVIYIRSNSIYNSTKEFYYSSKIISLCEKISDEELLKDYVENGNSGTLFIIDKTDKSILYTYTSITRPNIIGNSLFNNYTMHFIDPSKINRRVDLKNNVLPYYMMPKKYENKNLVYIEKIAENIKNYFVSEKAPTNATITRQNLIYTMVVTGANNNANVKLSNIFLKSFTFNILKLNESSNSSIFDKIIREILFEN